MAKKIGNGPDAPSEAENTAFNHDAVKSSAQSTKQSESLQGDYSIPGKKRKSYKEQGD